MCTALYNHFVVYRKLLKEKMTTASPQRRGMVFVDERGEYDCLSGQPVSPTASSSAESEDSYAEVYSDDSYHSEGEEFAEYWDPYLYQLQMQAPKPQCVACVRNVPDRPYFYGEEYHGSISREETARLLGTEEGNYLVRRGLSASGTYSLSFVFDKQVRHYRLFYEGHVHYVGDKPFDTIEDLVQDGLITLYMEANNVEEYLKSARETRTVRHYASVSSHAGLSTIQELSVDEPVFEETGRPARNRHDCMPRKPLYYPCTIPQRKDSVNSPPSVGGVAGGVVGEEEEQLPLLPEEEETKKLLMKGYVTPHAHQNGAIVEDKPVSPTRERKESSLYFYEKPHNFKLHNYSMAWCDYCRNFMWGLRNQGYKCKDCGYNVHKQCKDDTASDCQPSRQLVKRVYGVELTTLVKMECTKVPIVVKNCIEEIEKRGVEIEGIYRISGKTNDILRIKKQFDNDDMHADLESVEDIHALTGALKLYFRELPVPLMTFDAYDLCLIAARTGSLGESLEMLKVALSRLPPAHYNTLRHLMRHLNTVQQHKTENKMDYKNLAVVFTPSIMRSPYNNTGIMAVQKLPEQKKAVDMLIQNFNTLFNTR